MAEELFDIRIKATISAASESHAARAALDIRDLLQHPMVRSLLKAKGVTLVGHAVDPKPVRVATPQKT